jgi:hypothetical protein
VNTAGATTTGVTSTEVTPAPGPTSTSVLDIGGEVGALVVLLAARPAGGELEAEPAGSPHARFHTGVHHRELGRHSAWVAVFPEVVAGTYHLLDEGGSPLATVSVAGGAVRHLDLR